MLKVDFRRMFTMPLLYIMVGICLVIPILILVMTTMMEGSVSVNPQTGEETVMEGFDNTWQIIGTVSSERSESTDISENPAMSMDMLSMCNINMLYFFIAALVGLFVTEDFKSGYSKNIFAIRPKKAGYVVSKTVVGFVGGALMLVAFLVGTIIGGAIAGLPFDVGVAGVGGIIMCMLSKILLVAVFVPIYVLMSVIAKQRAWLAIVGSFCVGMLLFTMIPMLTPLNSGIMNVVLCLAGGALFSLGLGAISNQVLRKTSLV